MGGVVHGSIDVECGPPHDSRTLLNLPKVLFACSIPFDTVFVGWVEKSGGGLSSGGIQFAKDVEMLPSVPQLTMRLSLLGCGCSHGGEMIGVVRRGDVIRRDLEGSGGTVLGRASRNPGLGSQAEEEGEFSLQTLSRYFLNSVRFAWGTAHAPTWLALLLQSTKHSPRMCQRAHMKKVSSHLGRSVEHFPAKSRLQSSLSFIRNSVMGAAFLMM